MGLCFSKKKSSSPPPNPPPNPIVVEKKVEKKTKKKKEEVVVVEMKANPVVVAQASKPTPEVVVSEKKPVFAITQNIKPAAIAVVESNEKKKEEIPTKKTQQEVESSGGEGEETKPVPVRTSSCTKEEVDAILIQCGRLSRSSSGKAPNETNGSHRRYSGSKRSYDFDHEKKGGEEEDWEKPVSRPSPHRRTPGRERSGSRERGGSGGGRRVSRSPGRRSEGPASSASMSERVKQPGKMVSVPAREKGGGVGSTEVGVRKASPAMSNKRSSSPRSRSPANAARMANENSAINHNSLSRNSSRKAEHSPYRRNPMAEIDENLPRKHQNGSNNIKMQKASEGQALPQKVCKPEQRNGGAAEVVEEAVEVKGAPKTNGAHSMNVIVESLNPKGLTRSRSSRRSSRDFDHNVGLNPDIPLNPTSYTSLLLEDIQNYHHQHNTAFSLPACVSKACSILEAVADLNSSSSENKSYEADRSNNDKGSINGRYGMRGLMPREPFLESEIVVNHLLEPSLHKYVTVRELGGEMEPQESAGSNSFVGPPWASSWEPNSVESTDWTSRSNNGEEVEQEGGGGHLSHSRLYKNQLLQEASCDLDARERRLRGGSSSSNLAANSSSKKSHVLRGGGGSVRSGKSGSSNKALSAPVVAAASS
ncbi:uncharacterized protein At1g65710 [Typha latifolia]|uniref:uncharacterized protein At1g65710 n=1 Tax=Typha latifolia TaxID=4733 RepID=UPI003C2D3EB3